MQRAVFLAVCLVVLTTPLGWRVLVGTRGLDATGLPASYLPALEPVRERYPFDPKPIEDLRTIQPGIVLIGDSMSLRIDPERLEQLSGVMVARLLRLATGSAHWYLLFKNYVIPSGVTPQWVIVFFRDDQLTDPMFRLTGVHRGGADPMALDREDALNAVVAAHVGNPWFRVHALVDRLYAVDRARDWLEPALTSWVGNGVAGAASREAFVTAMNARFGLDHLRPFVQADIADPEDGNADFGSQVGDSTLPLMLDLAQSRGLRLCFVRVLRRPQDGRPPRESAALRRYVADLTEYLRAHGAAYLDDRSVPELAQLAYDDGDHILEQERRRYTEIFYRRLQDIAR